MSLGWPQILLVALLVLVLFGRGRISEMMGDVGKGIRSFKKGINEEDEAKAAPRIETEQKVHSEEASTKEPETK